MLQRRFPNKETAQHVAYSLNMSQDTVYQFQRSAVRQLAQVIWDMEMELREKQAQELSARLEPPTYTQLFGIEEKIAALRPELEAAVEPWLFTLEGMGGIGKTTLADALARELAYGPIFRDLAWISARRRLFHATGQVAIVAAPPDLTLQELVEHLIAQFNLSHLRHQADGQKYAGVKAHLKSQPCLVVIDNLETVADYHALVPSLRELAGPSKFLLTTRYSLRGESGVYIFQLTGLNAADTFALIRHEATLQRLPDLATATDDELAPVYRVTAGNPLAIKLIIGQVHTFPLADILGRLRSAQDDPAADLLDFMYAEAWKGLDGNARRVMAALLLVTEEGGQLEQIAATTELGIHAAANCLRRLAELSLVEVKGDLHERRYRLHPLTRIFVTQQLQNEGESF